MVQERPQEYEETPPQETTESLPDPPQETSETGSDIGISSLMNKRAKLEEAIDYVGGLISNLKDGLRESLETKSRQKKFEFSSKSFFLFEHVFAKICFFDYVFEKFPFLIMYLKNFLF